jgi:hypothetical protein
LLYPNEQVKPLDAPFAKQNAVNMTGGHSLGMHWHRSTAIM